MTLTPEQRIELHGFNNLTKSLSFNMYDICYTKTKEEREAYINYIDEQYNAERLTNILSNVTDIIGAHILNIAKQDYVPQGSSVTILVSEGPVDEAPMMLLKNHRVHFRKCRSVLTWIKVILRFILIRNIILMTGLVLSVLI